MELNQVYIYLDYCYYNAKRVLYYIVYTWNILLNHVY